MAKASKPAAKKASAKNKALTKSAFVTELVETAKEEGATVSKKVIDALLDKIVKIIEREVGPKGAGKFVLPGVCRVTVTRKDAVKGGEKKTNRLTGAEYITKDKPAYNQVKLRPVKSLKDSLK